MSESLSIGERAAKLRTAWYRQSADVMADGGPRQHCAAAIERDCSIILKQANTNPPWLAVRSAAGAFLEDVTGQALLDLHGNNCHHIGYSHPDLVEALSQQMHHLPFVPRGCTNTEVVAAAEKLAGLWPYGPAVIALVPGGSAAVELAIMLCRAHTGRYKLVSFYGAYHGRSAGALSLGGRLPDRSPRLGPLLPGALHVRSFYPLANEDEFDPESAARRSFEDLSLCFEQEGPIAALFAETIRNGPFVPPAWYWSEVRKLCTRYGVLIVSDEIPMGLGKTGRLFVTEHFDLRPDVTLIGKSLGGAILPVAAVIASADLNSTADLNLGYFTYERSPIMARTASTVLDIIEREGLVARAAEVGKIAIRKMQALAATRSEIKEIRSTGAMLGVRLCSCERAETLARRTFLECLRRGVLLQYPNGSRLTLSFPLIVDENLVERALAIFGAAVDAAMSEGSAAIREHAV
jgi:(R)-1-hydroxy-2-aminoethylphosphonate ammonia-lyase